MAVRTKALIRSSYKQTVLKDGPIAYWRLGEASGTRASSEVSGNAGTYTGGYTLAQTGALAAEPDGTSNTAVLLNGTTGYVTVPDGMKLASTMTIEAWIKTSSSATDNAIACHFGTPSYTGWLFEVGGVTAGKLSMYVGVGGWTETVLSVNDGAWHHVAATVTGGIVRLYIDGALAATSGSITTTLTLATTHPLEIARRFDGTPAFFNGTIDDVALYATALPVARILAHYTAGLNQAKGDVATARTVAVSRGGLATARTKVA